MFITPADLAAFADIDSAKAEAMIEDAEAMAVLAAPCLSSLEDPAKFAAVKAILRGVILRWNEAGTGALTQRSETAGPFNQSESFDTRTQRRAMFWPSEIAQLRDLCSTAASGSAFTVDTAPGSRASGHSPTCNLFFGGGFCSCGASLTAGMYPLYEV